jgi:hypothetical protein
MLPPMQHCNLVPGGGQTLDHTRPNESRCADDQNLHVQRSSCARMPIVRPQRVRTIIIP